jgi:pimeloyl-ACP methyl ester carboxylesterase
MRLVHRLASRATKQTVAAIGLAVALAGGSDSALAQKRILQIESQGARAFGGINLYNPADPSGSRFLACDHGYVDWQIPPGARKRPLVMTHGSGTRGYQTTFDGQPGFQSIFLGEKHPVYLVDFPRTGRAGQGCAEYTYTINLNQNAVFQNRIGLWPLGQPQPTYFPGVAFSQDPEALNQFLRIQYPEFNSPENEDVESDALAILLEEVYAEHDKKPLVMTHSSGNTRGWLTALKTDKVGAIVAFESCSMFPEGEVPPPFPLANGGTSPYTGRVVALQEFLKLTKFPILVVFGDYIPAEDEPLDGRGALRARCLIWAETINNHGGNAKVLTLPDVGVYGNTHYPFADTNHRQVADQIKLWMAQQGLDKSCGAGNKKCK